MTTDLQDLFRLNKAQVKPAAEVLARAFWDFPVSTYAYPDELIREKRLPYFFSIDLHYCLRYGEAYATSSRLEGVAAWLPSNHFPMTVWKILRSVPLSIFFNLRLDNAHKMKAFADYVDGVHKRLAPFRHWYLHIIGVAPHHQGKGYAGKLLRPMLARIDKQGLPCFLETVDERDVAIYKHFGFNVVDESIVPATGITSWAMLRQ